MEMVTRLFHAEADKVSAARRTETPVETSEAADVPPADGLDSDLRDSSWEPSCSVAPPGCTIVELHSSLLPRHLLSYITIWHKNSRQCSTVKVCHSAQYQGVPLHILFNTKVYTAHVVAVQNFTAISKSSSTTACIHSCHARNTACIHSCHAREHPEEERETQLHHASYSISYITHHMLGNTQRRRMRNTHTKATCTDTCWDFYSNEATMVQNIQRADAGVRVCKMQG